MHVKIDPIRVFSQTHKIGNVGINADVIFPYISSFLLYLYQMMLVNVKLKVSGWENCISRLQTSLVCSSFLTVQLKRSWQDWHSCIVDSLWKTLLLLTCLLLNGSTVMVSAPMSMILPRVNPSIGCGTHTFLPSSILQIYCCASCTCFPTCSKYNEWTLLFVVLRMKANVLVTSTRLHVSALTKFQNFCLSKGGFSTFYRQVALTLAALFFRSSRCIAKFPGRSLCDAQWKVVHVMSRTYTLLPSPT